VDYVFTSADEFQDLIKNNGLLEWAQVYGNYYGVPRGPIREALSNGEDTVVKVDIQGAATIKKLVPEAIFIFLAPPSLDTCAYCVCSSATQSRRPTSARASK